MRVLTGGFVLLCAAASARAQTLYTEHGNPTADEQFVLEIINRARANPAVEGARLAIPGGITEGLTAGEMADVGPRPPLAMNSRLLLIARAHSLDMWTRIFFDHRNPDGLWPDDRATAAGYPWNLLGENIATGTNHTAEMLGDILMIDAGYLGRGHRKNLLDIDAASSTYYREIGVGYYSGAFGVDLPPAGGGLFKDFITQDFGRTATGPFMVGVVYHDLNNNNFYDIGEGLAGVTVTPSAGGFNARAAFAGGYAFPKSAAGSINVTASGLNLPADIVVAVVLNGENQKADFRVAPQADGDADGLPDFWETRFGGNRAPGVDDDGDSYTNLQEYQGGSDPGNAASTPLSPNPGGGGPPPPPAPGGGSSKKSSGGCGLTGLEALALLALLRVARRP